MNDAKVLSDCRGLSSGTIASLCGQREYERIDAVQQRFVAFVEYRQSVTPGCFEQWQDAWNEFIKE